jgi:hypothetical protein
MVTDLCTDQYEKSKAGLGGPPLPELDPLRSKIRPSVNMEWKLREGTINSRACPT